MSFSFFLKKKCPFKKYFSIHEPVFQTFPELCLKFEVIFPDIFLFFLLHCCVTGLPAQTKFKQL